MLVRGFSRRALLIFAISAAWRLPVSATPPPAACATDDQLYTVTPCSVSPGGTYKIVIRRDPSARPPSPRYDSSYTLRCAVADPQAAKVSVFASDASQAGFWTGSLAVDQGAQLGDNFLLLKIYPDGTTCADPAKPKLPPSPAGPILEELLPFRVGASAPGVSAPDSAPAVDVAWKVLSKNVVSDNFGSRIAKLYYGILVYVGNNAGYDIQLAGVYFKLPASAGLTAPLPSDQYRTVRSSLEREELVGLRNTSVSLLRAAGPILAGAIPFFTGSTAAARNRKYNFQIFLDIFSNPFEKMVELVFPDLTVSQLVALDNQALRDGAILANHTSSPLLVFVDKGAVVPPGSPNPRRVQTSCAASDFQCDYLEARYQNRNRLRSRFKSDHDPLQVMRALGELTLVGKYVAYGDRLSFSGKAAGTTPAQPAQMTQPAEMTQPAQILK